MIKTSYSLVQAYVTKDGSEIRELMHPTAHGNRNLSLAEAIVRPGTETRLHRQCVLALYARRVLDFGPG